MAKRVLRLPLQTLPLGNNAWVSISYNKTVIPRHNFHSSQCINESCQTKGHRDTTTSISTVGITSTATRRTITTPPIIFHNSHGSVNKSMIARRYLATTKDSEKDHDGCETSTTDSDRPTWNDEWEKIGLGAEIIQTHDDSDENSNINKKDKLIPSNPIMTNLLFVQTGFGIDQHGDRAKDGATKAAVRAVRNAIEFNSIPGVIESVPGGRANMLIHVLLGVPLAQKCRGGNEIEYSMEVDLSHVAKVFPYGKLLPIKIQQGGLSFPTGRVVHELGDEDDMAICVAACVSIGYDSGERDTINITSTTDTISKSGTHKTYDTRDGL